MICPNENYGKRARLLRIEFGSELSKICVVCQEENRRDNRATGMCLVLQILMLIRALPPHSFYWHQQN